MKYFFLTLLCSGMVVCALQGQTLNIPTANNVNFWGGDFGPTTLNINDTSLFLSHSAPRQFMLGLQWHYLQRIAHHRFSFNSFSRGLDLHDRLFERDWNDAILREWLVSMHKTGKPIIAMPSFSQAIADFRLYAMQYDAEAVGVQKLSEEWKHHYWQAPTGETDGAMFGYRYSHPNAIKYVQNGTGYLKLTSAVNSSTSLPIVALDSVSPDDNFYRYCEGQENSSIRGHMLRDSAEWYTIPTPNVHNSGQQSRQGFEWFVSIKLRRDSSGNSIMDNAHDTATVLKIKLPFKTNGGAFLQDSVIWFATLPRIVNGFVSTATNTTRGLVDSLHNNVSQVTPEFIIRRNMLPLAGAGDITLSAGFVTNPDPSIPLVIRNPFTNKEHNRDSTDSSAIRELGIKVEYVNNADVSIDWVRIETAFARRAFRGEYDTNFVARLAEQSGIFRRVRDSIASARATTDPNCGAGDVHIYQYYGNDELDTENKDRPQSLKKDHQYKAHLMNKVFTSEGVSQLNYTRSVPSTDIWVSGFTSVQSKAMPYFRWMSHDSLVNNNGVEPFNRPFKFPFSGIDNTQPFYSKWDGRMPQRNFGNNYDSDLPYIITNYDSLHLGALQTAPNAIWCNDIQMYRVPHKNSQVLYNGKPWISNIFSAPGGVLSVVPNYANPNRVILSEFWNGVVNKTGEELRLESALLLALGCKGIMYDVGDPVHYGGEKYENIRNNGGFTFTATAPWGDPRHGWALPLAINPQLAQQQDYRLSFGIQNMTSSWNPDFEGRLSNQSFYDVAPPYEVPSSYYDNSQQGRAYSKPWATRFIESDAYGSDFIAVIVDSAGNYVDSYDQTNVDRYIDWNYNISSNPNPQVRTLGIDKRRFYLGRKSARYQMMKQHDYLMGSVFPTHPNDRSLGNSVADYLLRLRLQAWQHHGIVSFGNCITNKDSVDSTFKQFVRLDKGFWMVTKAYACPDVDTAKLFDVMIHAEQSAQNPNINIPLDSVFVLAVVNKRQSPLVHAVGSNQICNDTASDLTFRSTFEFDSLVNAGVYDKYAQGGARTYHIPFENTTNSYGKVQYEIREIGGSLDTVVQDNTILPVKFLPGELKFFRVRLLKNYNNIAIGSLANSNQRKLISFPTISYIDSTGKAVLSKDSVQYHLVYHRPRQYPDTTGDRQVFYRRSLPTVSHSATLPGLVWENERNLSATIIRQDSSLLGTPTDCAFPSIVVRIDTVTEIPQVYVVYACTPYLNCVNPLVSTTENLVCANIFRAEGFQNVGIGHEIANYQVPCSSDPLSHWGFPTIGAINGGQFIAYSTPDSGIVASYQPNGLYNVIHPRSIRSNLISIGLGDSSQCNYPCLSSYSRIRYQDSTLALVWRETNDNDLQGGTILYTRVSNTPNGIVVGLPQQITNTINSDAVNFDSTIVRVSYVNGRYPVYPYPYLRNEYPVVHTDVSHDILTENTINNRVIWDSLSKHYTVDIIHWTNIDENNQGAIHNRSILIHDTTTSQMMNPSFTSLANPSTISLFMGNLFGPSSGQGDFDPENSDHAIAINKSGRAVSLSMWATAQNLAGQWSQKMYQIPHSLFMGAGGFNIGKKHDVSMQFGFLPHVSTTWEAQEKSDYSKNRRVFQSDFPKTYSDIYSTTQGFYKTVTKENRIDDLIGFQSASGSFLSTDLKEHTKGNVSNTLTGINTTLNYVKDTLSTDWFMVDQFKQINFKYVAKGKNVVKLYIERKNSSKLIPIDSYLPNSSRFTYKNKLLQFGRGGNAEFRIVAVNLDPKSSIIREKVLEGLEDEADLAKETELESSITYLDLDNSNSIGLSTYPNPTDSKISIVVAGEKIKNEKFEFKIVNVLGVTQKTMLSESNSIVADISDLPNGVYSVQCNYISRDFEKQSVWTQFIINR